MKERTTILIAEDVEINRAILKEMFEEQYEVAEAENGQVAIDYLYSNGEKVACLLLDLVMPVKTGFDVMEYMKEAGMVDAIPIILITGDDSKETEEIAYNYGAADIIYKPYIERVVMRRVKNVVDLYSHKNHMEALVQEKTLQIQEQSKQLKETNEMILDALGSVVGYKTNESKEHTRRIRKFTRIMLKYAAKFHPEFELDEEHIDMIVRATALHDIGKLGIPDEVLLKYGKLSPADERLMQSHTTIGCEILESFSQISDQKFYDYCYDICRHHHERWDGSGYPDKLAGDEISFVAQIVSLVDAYEELVTENAYHTPYTHQTAVQAIMDGEEGVFSPMALECFQLSNEEFQKLVEFSDKLSLL